MLTIAYVGAFSKRTEKQLIVMVDSLSIVLGIGNTTPINERTSRNDDCLVNVVSCTNVGMNGKNSAFSVPKEALVVFVLSTIGLFRYLRRQKRAYTLRTTSGQAGRERYFVSAKRRQKRPHSTGRARCTGLSVRLRLANKNQTGKNGPVEKDIL